MDDAAGRRVVPEEHFNLGGKTKWYGAALARFGAAEFAAEPERHMLRVGRSATTSSRLTTTRSSSSSACAVSRASLISSAS